MSEPQMKRQGIALFISVLLLLLIALANPSETTKQNIEDSMPRGR